MPRLERAAARLVPIDDGHPRAFLEEPRHGRGPDAARATGHDDAFLCETFHTDDPCPFSILTPVRSVC